MDEKRIGLKMSRLREEQGLTTTELAERVGISQAQISRLENGLQGFRSSTLARIAHALGVKPVYFYLDEVEGPRGSVILEAPGKVGEALKHPEFRALIERAAALYLEKGQAFSGVERAINESVSGGS